MKRIRGFIRIQIERGRALLRHGCLATHPGGSRDTGLFLYLKARATAELVILSRSYKPWWMEAKDGRMPPHHPYQALPQHTRWSRGVAAPAAEDVDPVVNFPFRITPEARVATAGSCFAQHIAKHLARRGLNHFVVEDGHPLGNGEFKRRFNYGTFSARYGNVYTARQLLQLFDRAFDRFVASDDHWISADGAYIDPLRPNIQPHGFASLPELQRDRAQHLGAVRRMFEQLDYFIFTLGLTEAWYDRRDGAVYPLCPGVASGRYDAERHGFVNFDPGSVVADLRAFVEALREVNPAGRVILTVSPVPLVATAVDRHVLVSNTYSKSVLRVACEEICAAFPNVAYFPSYEIITGGHAQGAYFEADRRTITQAGVEQVMGLFFRHATTLSTEIECAENTETQTSLPVRLAAFDTVCDEEMIEASLALAQRSRPG